MPCSRELFNVQYSMNADFFWSALFLPSCFLLILSLLPVHFEIFQTLALQVWIIMNEADEPLLLKYPIKKKNYNKTPLVTCKVFFF